MRMSGRVRVGVCLAGVTALLALAGCSGSTKHDSSSASSLRLPAKAAAGAGSAASANANEPVTDNALSSAGTAGGLGPAKAPSTPLQQRDVVYTATLSVQVHDVDRSADAITAAAEKYGGRVDGDNRSATATGARKATLVLRLPSPQLAPTMASTAALGKELSRTLSGSDVTAQHADIDARVQALQTSIARLRGFLSKSASIKDLLSLESALSQRQAELESIQAQQRALADSIQLATLTVSLSTPTKATAAVLAPSGHHPSGFGHALAGGWHALVLVWRYLAAGLGYVGPFLIVLLALAVPGAVYYRRRVRTPVVREDPAAAATP